MTSIIRGVWIASPAGTGDLSAADVKALEGIDGVVQAAVYEVIPPDDHFSSMLDNVGHLVEEKRDPPTALVLTEWDSLRASVAAEKELRALPVEREGGGRSVVNRALFIKTSPVIGKHDAEYDTFGPNIQLGQFNMPDSESEFALAEWYEVHRLEPFTHLDGSIRASRLSVIAGPTKFGVIYEFTSHEAHQGFLHGIEARSHDPNDEMGGIVPLTVHSWLSPAWGQRVF